MSYTRRNADSDTYVIATKGPSSDQPLLWQCLGCSLMTAQFVPERVFPEPIGTIEAHWGRDVFIAVTPGDMHAHLMLHRAAGQKVHGRALDRLAEENAKYEADLQIYIEKTIAEAKERALNDRPR